MSESLTNTSEKRGLPPGSLIHIGHVQDADTRMAVIDYSRDNIVERQIQSLEEILEYKDSDTITWVIIEGLRDVGIIEKIGLQFGIHPLVLEDILNTHQRPKLEEYDNYLYIVLKSLAPENGDFTINYEQISLVVLKNFVFTFKEKTDDLFDPLIQRVRNSKGRIRNLGPDYLTYAILDTIVDQNFVLIDALDETVNALEDELFNGPTQDTLNRIQRIKREIIRIRKNTSPVRELMSELERSESALIHESTHIYLRDVSDHTIRVIESIESYREILSSLVEIYISSVSNKLNEVMKVLTVFAAIFIPLTFLAGVYGMNFEYMPELKWHWAYPVLWLVFISITVGLLCYFRRKKWL